MRGEMKGDDGAGREREDAEVGSISPVPNKEVRPHSRHQPFIKSHQGRLCIHSYRVQSSPASRGPTFSIQNSMRLCSVVFQPARRCRFTARMSKKPTKGSPAGSGMSADLVRPGQLLRRSGQSVGLIPVRRQFQAKAPSSVTSRRHPGPFKICQSSNRG